MVIAGFVHSQEVVYKNTTYTVKKGLIFKGGYDVTNSLSIEDQNQIRSEFNKAVKEKEAEKKLKKKEKEYKKAQKKQRSAEKKLKRVEKELQKKLKAERAVEKAKSNLENAHNKYEKLRKKGKLSPVDETKWVEKIKKLNDRLDTSKKKLSRL